MKRMQGFQKPIDSGKRREVGMAVIKTGETHSECSCGQPFKQPREKVRENAIDAHINEKHDGRGIRL